MARLRLGLALAMASVLVWTVATTPATAAPAARTKVTTAWVKRAPLMGHQLALHGKVTPVRGKRSVHLQRRVGARWVTVRRVTVRRSTARSPRYAMAVPTIHVGSYRYRTFAPRTRYAQAQASRGVTVRVRARGNRAAHSFISVDGPGDLVARWNPCRAIGYRVNARLGGNRAVADTKQAFARISQFTGLRFRFRGSTRIIPGARNEPARPRDTQLVVAWARPGQSRHLSPGGPAGVGGPSWTQGYDERGRREGVIGAGFVVLDATRKLARGFGSGPRFGVQGTRGQLLMHELGHAIGLGHPRHSDRWQIMHPTMQRKPATWGAGDLAGLRRLGASRGCLSLRPPSGVRQQTVRSAAVTPSSAARTDAWERSRSLS